MCIPRVRRFASLIIGVLVLGLTAGSHAEEPSALPSRHEQLRFFEQRIRPLLAENCFECHGAEKQEGELRLDDWPSLNAGGSSGRAIIAGDPHSSLLIAAVSYRDSALQMPPAGKLNDEQIADLAKWIEWGAAHPGALIGATANANVNAAATEPIEGRDHWAFQPLQRPALPAVQHAAWPQSPLDYFVLAQLEKAGLSPAPPADKRTLIRRASLDLIGLPPTIGEVECFLNDESPDAFARVVDRLLASPHYGERWGRHWLDVARYADSNGSDENIAHGHAWRYRDYVIEAFNADKPYGQFVLEQLAGDLLPTDDPLLHRQRLTATAFLALGPKVLAEVDELKMEMDIIDEQVDTIGQAFLGLTLGCARCHDHKFDPISTRDYYAVAGIFKSTRTMENFTKIARWWENEIALPDEKRRYEEHEALIGAVRKSVADLVASATAELQTKLGEGAALPEKPEEDFSDETKTKLVELRAELAALEAVRAELPTSMGVTEGKPVDLAVCVRGSHLTLGDVVPRGLPRILVEQPLAIPAESSGRLQLAEWIAQSDNPLPARVIANRVWRWHFGRGIVVTPDNFGRLGSTPTHPQLLDWLAAHLQQHGGSLKQLHRTILLSSTYQMSSEWDSLAAERDPENQLLWRAPLQRLEAEVLRDSLLSVAQQLDGRMGGSMLHVKNREFFFDHTSIDKTSYSTARRSVYLPIVRNHQYEVFQLFDYTDAAVVIGNRSSTTVPTQALFFMNGDLVQDAAAALAKQCREQSTEDSERIGYLYRQVLGRDPNSDELQEAISFVAQAAVPPAALQVATGTEEAGTDPWTALAHVLLVSNEFLYVR